MADTRLKHCFLSPQKELFTGTLPVPDVHLHDLLLQKLLDHGEKILYVNYPDGATQKANEARNVSLKLATYLHSIGITENDIVFGYAANNEIYACTLLACSCIGAVFTGCLFTLTIREVRNQLTDTQAKVILCSKETIETSVKLADECDFVKQIIVMHKKDGSCSIRKTGNGKMIIPVSEVMKTVINNEKVPLKLRTSPLQTVAAICYSSGSTGAPKGVMKTHTNLIASCYNSGDFIATMGFPGDVVSFHQPIPHISGVLFAVNSMFSGNKCIINKTYNMMNWLDIVSRFKVTHSFVAPSYVNLVSKSDEVGLFDVSSLNRIVTGGAPISETIAKKFVERMKLKRLSQDYGSTEASIFCNSTITREGRMKSFTQNYGSTEISLLCNPPDCEVENYRTCGVPVANMRLRIVDRDSGKNLDANQVGEVQVKGNEVTIGYNKRPDADAENFTADGWLKTGDAGYYDETGLLYIVDRYKELIKVDTQQVAPVEIESLLLLHESVAEAAVVGVPDEIHGEVPKAFVVLRENTDPDLQEIKKFANDQLSVHKHIHTIVAVKTLPKISIGKIDRSALKKM